MAKDSKILKKAEQPVSRQFGYELDGITLSFTLRVDVKRQLKAWLALMEAAREDIEKELARLDEGKGAK